ncbi:uncharacterized protein G2W53_032753 [Senna tora]|uniref:Uncharacterized protein n=1 Tax=Senna tora TaxID=362788 RepID=A0A834W780_9FABA|nr:uncharacterized protein G2W53_032753 [Senna tora]
MGCMGRMPVKANEVVRSLGFRRTRTNLRGAVPLV